MSFPTVNILYVEDNPGDARLAAEVFDSVPRPCRLHVARDGDEAMAFLRRQGPYAAAPRPQLILLDLGLPGRSGQEVLAEIKSDDTLKRIPVVIFSSSDSPIDITQAYRARANSYVVKPGQPERLREVLVGLEEFWVVTVSLPPA